MPRKKGKEKIFMKRALWLGLIGVFMLSLGACAGPEQSAVEGQKGKPASQRYTVSPEGVINDAQTGLEWVVGPDRDLNHAQAVQWVASCSLAGGRWRMPTRHELKTLYQKGSGERNLDPAFKTTGWWVWAEARDSTSAWSFSFNHGCITWDARLNSTYGRVFGVRSGLR
jgi:hypothetical protein